MPYNPDCGMKAIWCQNTQWKKSNVSNRHMTGNMFNSDTGDRR